MKKFLEAIGSRNGKAGFSAVLLAAGLLLLLLPALLGENRRTEKAQETAASEELSAYAALLEDGLKEAVCRVVGGGDVSVMVTLDSTFENVYVNDASINEAVTADKTDRKSERQLVLIGANGENQIPVVVKRLPPKVRGAVIVCTGGNDPALRARITALAATVLNVSETKIYVTGGN